MTPQPIKITLYNSDDSVKAEYSRLRIPLGMVEIALDLAESLDQKKGREALAAVEAFVVEIFGNQFTLDELRAGADAGEIRSVLTSILARVGEAVRGMGFVPIAPGPTLPGKKPRQKKTTIRQ